MRKFLLVAALFYHKSGRIKHETTFICIKNSAQQKAESPPTNGGHLHRDMMMKRSCEGGYYLKAISYIDCKFVVLGMAAFLVSIAQAVSPAALLGFYTQLAYKEAAVHNVIAQSVGRIDTRHSNVNRAVFIAKGPNVSDIGHGAYFPATSRYSFVVHADTYRQHPDISFIVAVVGSHFATNSAVIAPPVHIQIAQACIRHIAGAVAVVDKFFTFYAQGQNFGIAVDVDCAL